MSAARRGEGRRARRALSRILVEVRGGTEVLAGEGPSHLAPRSDLRMGGPRLLEKRWELLQVTAGVRAVRLHKERGGEGCCQTGEEPEGFRRSRWRSSPRDPLAFSPSPCPCLPCRCLLASSVASDFARFSHARQPWLISAVGSEQMMRSVDEQH